MEKIKCSIDKSTWYEVYIEYDISTNSTTKKSTMSHALYIKVIKGGYHFSGDMDVTYKVAGKSYGYQGNFSVEKTEGYTKKIKGGTTTVKHDSTTGIASFPISCSGRCNSGGHGPGNISLSKRTVNASKRFPMHDLKISAGTGCSVTVNRTSSDGGSTGTLKVGTDILYYGDKLKITFTPSAGYAIANHTVNGSAFTSGKTHTVSGNVSIVATATPQISKIGATDANIESVSTITVTRYNSAYTHTIEYKFGRETGTVVSGSRNTSIAWKIPKAFYAQIPNAKSGKCELTCKTYSGSTLLGTQKCTLNVTAASANCSPVITGITVQDTYADAPILTGDNQTLIKYKSCLKCTVKAIPQNNATISAIKINGQSAKLTASNGVTTGTISYPNTSVGSINFSVTDSRSYTSSQSETFDMVNYIALTCNPVLYRPTPTGNSIVIKSLSGNFYGGSFGACNNELVLQYRYKKSTDADYSSWATIPSSSMSIGTKAYSINSATKEIPLDGEFDYNDDYIIQIKAEDGGTVNETKYALSTVIKSVNVPRGIPVFDWGKVDFKFNVPVIHQKYIIFPKVDAGIYGTNSSGNATLALNPCDASNNLILGKGNYDKSLGTTQIYGNSVEINSKNTLKINNRIYGANKVLWSGASYMFASQTANLSEAISAQPNGIVLVFSRYIDGAVNNSTFSTHFVSKYQVAAFPGGGGYTFFLVNNAAFTVVGAKYLKITDTQIIGHDDNSTTESVTNGISHTNKGFVLRYVIGV